jgi:predicted TIM-barrel fold metal-dependent hydrolase
VGEAPVRPVSIVSVDGHAVMPEDAWPDYLENRFHDNLPAFRAENGINRRAMFPLNDMLLIPALDVFDGAGAYRAERWRGAWDADVRLAEMDREGIAAEVVFHGFFRVSDLGFSVMNARYPPEVVDAGVRAYNRWVFDVFGGHPDRLLLVGAVGACTDLEAAMAEARWIADHGFLGMYMPGFLAVPGQPPLDDPSWDPLWASCAERGLVLVVHGGYGLDQGYAFEKIQSACRQVDEAGGSELDLVMALAQGIFSEKFFSDLRHRRAMWQLMLGGVFDRHPRLKLMMTEVRADWIPATLDHLDRAYESHFGDVPSGHRPSEWWTSNCLAGVSFMHRSEVAMRHEIGIESMGFGRDYPHAEGTWPNTRDYLRDLFAGVSENDVRQILGENAIRFFGIDAAEVGRISELVGPTVEQLTGGLEEIPRALIEHFNDRSGYLKPAEGAARLAEVDELLRADVERITAGSVR